MTVTLVSRSLFFGGARVCGNRALPSSSKPGIAVTLVSRSPLFGEALCRGHSPSPKPGMTATLVSRSPLFGAARETGLSFIASSSRLAPRSRWCHGRPSSVGLAKPGSRSSLLRRGWPRGHAGVTVARLRRGPGNRALAPHVFGEAGLAVTLGSRSPFFVGARVSGQLAHPSFVETGPAVTLVSRSLFFGGATRSRLSPCSLGTLARIRGKPIPVFFRLQAPQNGAYPTRTKHVPRGVTHRNLHDSRAR